MKKLAALLLALALSLSLIPNTLAAEAVTPTPPEWINAEDYVVFEDGKVYDPAVWEGVLQLRSHAFSGGRRAKNNPYWNSYLKLSALTEKPNIDPAAVYEKSLIDLMYHRNEGYSSWMLGNDVLDLLLGEDGGTWSNDTRWKLELWSSRWIYQMEYYDHTEEEATIRELPTRIPDFVKQLNNTMKHNGITSMERFLDCGTMDVDTGMKTYQWMSAAKVLPKQISVLVDGKTIGLDVPPEIKNQRTMVPVRAVGEAIGADVEWVQDKGQVVMTRAGSTVTMTLDSTTADIDGRKVEMDVAPYALNGRTLLPARYVAEFFGQKVDWDGERKEVLITEDKSALGNSNLEAWAMAMGLTYAYQYYGERCGEKDALLFGMYPRTAAQVQSSRKGLNNNWGGDSREHIISIVESMTAHGHNDSFQAAARDVNSLSPDEMAYLISVSGSTDQYMWPYTKALSEKWGDKGILAWDLSRMGAMVQWGYHVGRLTYEEALALVEPATRLTAENFSSWEEFYENYLDGYNWWARNNVVGKDPWETERGPLCRKMLENPILDDTLFTTGVIPLPDKEG